MFHNIYPQVTRHHVGGSIIQLFSRNHPRPSLKLSLLYTNYPAKNGIEISRCFCLLPAVEVSRISDNYHYIPPPHKEETSNFKGIVPT